MSICSVNIIISVKGSPVVAKLWHVEERERRQIAVEEKLPVDEEAWRVNERERRHETDEECTACANWHEEG